MRSNEFHYLRQRAAGVKGELKKSLSQVAVVNQAYYGRIVDGAVDDAKLPGSVFKLLSEGGPVNQQIVCHDNFTEQFLGGDAKDGSDKQEFVENFVKSVHSKKSWMSQPGTKMKNGTTPDVNPKSVRQATKITVSKEDHSGDEEYGGFFSEDGEKGRKRRGRVGPDHDLSSHDKVHGHGKKVPIVSRPLGGKARKNKNDEPAPIATPSSYVDAVTGDHAAISQSHERGMDRWTADEAQIFVQQARIMLDMPLSGAGASGTTAMLIMCARTMGLGSAEELKEYGLAVTGVLVAAGAHTFHEIMSVLKTVGVPYTPGDYRNVFPESFTKTAAYAKLVKDFPDLLGD